MPMTVPLPSQAAQEKILGQMNDLVKAIEAHPKWTPPSPDPGLFHVWDFVNRSRYIVEELDNIKEGKQLKHPEQIPKNEGATSNEERAQASFADVCTRSETINEMIKTPIMMMMLGLSQIDFGDDIRNKSQAVCDSLREANP